MFLSKKLSPLLLALTLVVGVALFFLFFNALDVMAQNDGTLTVRDSSTPGDTNLGTVNLSGQDYDIYRDPNGVPGEEYGVPVGGGGGDDDGPNDVCQNQYQPDLDLKDVYFVDELGNTVDQTKLVVGATYRPAMTIRNQSCGPTDAVFASGRLIYFNGSPYGTNGRFQVRADLEMSNYGPLIFNQFGPVPSELGSFLATPNTENIVSGTLSIPSIFESGSDLSNLRYFFPEVVFEEGDVGTRTFTASLDTNCNNPSGWGCIFESEGGYENWRNSYGEQYTVVRPTLELGSFLMPNANAVTSVSGNSYRNLPEGGTDQVGLYWSGDLIDFASCTGTVVNSLGTSFADFNAQNDTAGASRALNTLLPRRDGQNDINIGEPDPGVWRKYTIRCSVTGTRSSLEDSVTIARGISTPPSGAVALAPRVQDVTVGSTQVGVTIPFEIENDSPAPVTNYTTRIIIDSVAYGSITRTTTIANGNGVNIDHVQNPVPTWTAPAYNPAPGAENRVPYSICVNHALMGTESCSGAYLIISEFIVVPPPAPECSDGRSNDSDGLIDYDGGGFTDPDPGCTGPNDNTEDPNPECSDGIDNGDPDGFIDYDGGPLGGTPDPGCAGPDDNTEDPNPECSDGVNNSDGDTLVDYDGGGFTDPDPGCTGPNDNTEGPNPECSDGIDNDDNDTLVDYDGGPLGGTPDPGCTGPDDNTEGPNPAPTCQSFSVSPNPAVSGTPVTFTWRTSNADSVSIDNGIGNGLPADSPSGGLATTSPVAPSTTYTLTMTAADASTVDCHITPTLNTTADPSVIVIPTIVRQGDDVIIIWDPTGGTSCTLNPVSYFGGQDLDSPGAITITPSGSTAIIYECNGVEDRIDIRVIPTIFET